MSTPVEQARSRSTNASMKEEDRNPGVDKLMTTTILDYVHPDDEEKGESGEAVQGSTISSSVDEAYEIVGEVKVEYTLEEQREVRKKIDKVVPGLLAVVYLSQYLDKTSLSYSAVTGLPITGSQYNLVSMSFYLGYLIWEFPTQWIAQKVNPTMYLGFNIVAWSVCLALHAAAPNFAPFFALRFLTGMFESVVAPVLIMTIVAFYPREEQAVRISSFYLMNGFAEIFGGLLAWSITFYTGNSIAHWRIIYIILGGLALLVGIVVMIWLPASPTSARFLNEKEKRVALERVRSNASGTVQHRFKPHQAVEALKDTKVWLNLALVIVVSVPNGALSNFSSIIIKNLGYDSRESLILGVPKGVIASTTTLACGYLSDKRGERMLPILVAFLPAIVGCALLVGLGSEPEHHKATLILGVYLTATFGSALAINYSWNATNLAGSTKKSSVNAATLFSFAVGNIIGTEIFQSRDAPQYLAGKTAILILLSVGAVMCVTLRWLVVRENEAKRSKVQELKRLHGWDDQEVQRRRDANAFKDLTDKENPFFIYTP